MSDYFIGIDVGTTSARVGIFSSTGEMVGGASRSIKVWKEVQDHVEQSSDDIWDAVCFSVRMALNESNLKKDDIKGIGFDATCSLVVIDGKDKPLSVSLSKDNARNIIVWMDHRALREAELINRTNHDVLKYVGGKISPEMETPKLLWLKKNLPYCWNNAGKFFDLPDFLVYRATGKDVRSLCSTVCKWTYMGHVESSVEGSFGSWNDSYFNSIGLRDLTEDGYRKIGSKIRSVGDKIEGGLSQQAADELGLNVGTSVGVSIIDAHAGGLGVLGADVNGIEFNAQNVNKRLALIGGTSSCHMAVSTEASYVPGVWGPYFAAMVPGMWLTEGGQSATGALIDHIIFSHSRAGEIKILSETRGISVYDLLNERLNALSESLPFQALLTENLHVLPYFHGNRSPRANPSLVGMISGLNLSDSIESLAILYLSTIQAIAYGTRHIIEEMNKNGFQIDTIFACGGGTKNPVFLREHADITGCSIVLPKEREAVLLGSAVLGAVASGKFSSVNAAMSAMNKSEKIINPSQGDIAKFHNSKYNVFHKMYEDQIGYRKIMDAKCT